MSIQSPRFEWGNVLPSRIGLIGLQRTGTTYVQVQIECAFPNVVIDNGPIWKHAFANEIDGESLQSPMLLICRHPIMWLQSCTLNTPKDLRSRRNDIFRGTPNERVALAHVYTEFYRGWLNTPSGGQIRVLRYEDVLTNGITHCLLGHSSAAPQMGTLTSDEKSSYNFVPMSLQFSEADRTSYLRKECSIDRANCYEFWGLLDPDVTSSLQYDISEVTFVDRPTVRSVAYRFVESPDAATDDEFQKVMRLAHNEYTRDGPLLHQIARRLLAKGDVNETLYWGMKAQIAYSEAIEVKRFHSGAHAPLADALALIASAALSKRQTVINAIITHYAEDSHFKDNRPEVRRERHFYLSESYRRLGRLDDAIRHAQASVSEPIGPEERINPWLWHSLGALLREAERPQEAILAYERAAELEPDNFRHLVAASEIYLDIGQRESAIRLLESVVACNARVHDLFFYYLKVIAGQHERLRRDILTDYVDRNDQNADIVRRVAGFYSSEGLLQDALFFSRKLMASGQATYVDLLQNVEIEMKLGHLPNALGAADEAINIRPRAAGGHYMKAEVLLRMDSISPAVASAKTAAEFPDVNHLQLHFLGQLLILTRDYSGARAAFERAVVLAPEHSAHSIALANLSAEEQE